MESTVEPRLHSNAFNGALRTRYPSPGINEVFVMLKNLCLVGMKYNFSWQNFIFSFHFSIFATRFVEKPQLGR